VPVLDPIVALVAHYCVALLFLSAGYAKATALPQFRATMVDYELIPGSLAGIAAVGLVAIEIAIAIAAVFPATARGAMIGAAVLLVVYAGAIGINLARGRRDIDCGCMGPANRQLLSGWLLLRNGLLAALALIGTSAISERPLHAADFVLVAVALLGAAALYAAINQLMANAPRLDALDSLMDVG
jgi:hypothetical protein